MSRSTSKIRASRLIGGLVSFALAVTSVGAGLLGSTALGAAASAATNCTLASLSGAPGSHPFYIGSNGDANYVGWNVSASANISDAWAQVSSFSGNVKLSTNQPAAIRLGSLTSGNSLPAYFELMSTGASANPAGYTITIYNGNPSSGGSAVCTANDSFTSVASTISANANKVTAISLSTTAPIGGGSFTIDVTGQSGTIGSGDTGTSVGWFSPSVVSSWPANSLQLTGTKITFGSTTYTNRLVLTAADAAYKVGGNYTAQYTFVVKSSLTNPATIAPLAYIASGTQEKYTGSYPLPLPVITAPGAPAVYLTKTASVDQSTGITTFTVAAKNTDPANSVTLDDFIDTPSTPVANYISNSAKFNSVAVSNVSTAGGKLTFTGPFTVAANATGTLTYQMNASLGAGSNSVIAHVGSTTIGNAVNSSTPATASFTYGSQVTYYASGGGGTVPTDSSYYANGSTVTTLSGSSLTPPTGCQVFLGWATSPTGALAYTPPATFTITGPTSLYAVWSSCYPVAYDPNGGSGSVVYQTEVQGSDAIPQAPASPTLDGFTFGGWSTSPTATSGASSVTVNGPMTLYAVWLTNSFQVTYDPNGGSGSPIVKTETYNSDAIPQAPAAPTRTGYTFLGWSNSSTAAAPDTSDIVTGDMTLYAVWQLNTYQVGYHPNGGNGSIVYQTEAHFSDAIAQAPAGPSRTGYTFIGWSIDSSATVGDGSDTVTGPMTLYAVWQINSYVVTYNPNGGSGSNVTKSEAYNSDAIVQAPASPTRTGYSFAGWSLSPSATSGDFSDIVTGPMTLYAVWQIDTYVVTYNPNGGSGSNVTKSEAYNSDAIAQAPASPTRTGYTFIGWSLNPSAVTGDATDTVVGAMTLYAVWQVNTYRVIYHPNGGNGPVITKYEAYNTDAITQAPASPNRDGYTFAGWSLSPYAAVGDTSDTVTGAITLYAVWQVNSYVVSYYPNGGLGPVITKSEVYNSDAIVQSPAGPTRDGYTFIGWSISPNASIGDTSDIVTGAMNLYAVWQINTYRVTYHPNGGLGSAVTKYEAYNSDAIVQSPAGPSRTGYTFIGWSLNPSAITGDVTDTVTGAMTLYAVWQINTYRVTYDPNGGTGSPVSKYEAYNSDAITQAPASPTRDGYTFIGWSISPFAAVADSSDTVTGAMNLYALWQINSYRVTYDPNGGSGPSTVKSEVYNTDAIAQAPAAPTRTGYTFVGWSINSAATVGDTFATVTGPMTVYAVWTPITYKVTYNSSGGAGSTPVDPNSYITGATATTLSGAGLTPPSGCQNFLGWATSPYGAVSYVPPASFTVTGAATLYAVWSSCFPVTYDPNGGTGSATTKVEARGSDAVAQAPTAPTRDGFTFIGWSLSPSATVGDSSATVNGAMTMYAVWRVNTFPVTYNPNGGVGAITTKSEALGSDAIAQAPTSPTRDGYTFIGWSTNPSAAIGDVSATVNGAMTMYAVWQINTFRVIYHPNGGNGVASSKTENYNSDAIAQAPASPTRTGYTFLGWSTNPTATFGDSVDIVTGPLTLYAIWQINTFTVNYHPNGGSGSVVSKTENYNSDAIVQAPAAPTREGYTFLGWSTNPGASIGDLTDVVTGPLTIYAVWQLNTFRVTYHPNGGSGSASSQIENYGTDAIAQAPAAPSRSGYTFIGWSTNPAATSGDLSAPVNGAFTLYAIWQLNGFTVNYHPNGGSGSVTSKTENQGSDAVSQAPANPSRTGYTFIGWSLNPLATVGDSSATVNGSITLYAVWQLNAFAVTYNPNGGSGSNFIKSENYNSDAIAQAPASPTRSGYTFVGWSLNPSATVGDSSATVTGAITLYAVWTPVTYRITYGGSGGGGNPPVDPNSYPSGTSVPTLSGSGLTPPSGCQTFAGWALTPGGPVAFVPPAAVTVSGATTLYAVWSSCFAVSYDPNGGTGSVTTKTEAQGSDAITQAPANPTRNGFTFLGWSLSPNAVTADSTAVVNSAMTLYAVWQASSFRVTYDPNGGAGSATTKTEAQGSDAISQAPSNPIRNGYSFLGWSLNPSAATADSSATVTGAMTLYAVWQINTYRVTYHPNGGQGLPVDKTETKGSDAIAQAPGAPVRDGYTFLGWSTNSAAIVGDTYAAVSGSMTLYAIWQINTYRVTYHPNGGNGSAVSLFERYNSDAIPQAPASPIRAGYVFLGWSLDSGATVGDTSETVTGAMTLYAVWELAKYKVTYNAGGAAGPVPTDPTSYPNGSSAPTLPGDSLTPPSGCQSFAGWATRPGGPVAFVPPAAVTVTSATTLYAVWTGCFTVNYDPNGGTGSVVTKTEAIDSDAVLQAPSAPTRNGYIFSGWSISRAATVGDTSDIVSGPLTLFAVWTPTYTVTFNPNGGSNPPAPQTGPYAGTITLPNGPTPPAGCTFLGWSTKASATASQFAAGASYTVQGAVSLYAVYGNCPVRVPVTVVQTGSGSTRNGTDTLTTAPTLTSRVVAGGTKLGIVAQPAPGGFVVWGGVCQGQTGSTCWFYANTPTRVEAHFFPAGSLPVFYFDTNRWDATLSAADRARLSDTLRSLAAIGVRSLVVTGHADIRHTPTYNIWLSGKRASAAADYVRALASSLGLGQFTITTRASGATEQFGQWQSNRRASLSL